LVPSLGSWKSAGETAALRSFVRLCGNTLQFAVDLQVCKCEVVTARTSHWLHFHHFAAASAASRLLWRLSPHRHPVWRRCLISTGHSRILLGLGRRVWCRLAVLLSSWRLWRLVGAPTEEIIAVEHCDTLGENLYQEGECKFPLLSDLRRRILKLQAPTDWVRRAICGWSVEATRLLSGRGAEQ